MHTNARSGAKASSAVSVNGVGGHQVKFNSDARNSGLGPGLAYSAEEAQSLGLLDLKDLNGPLSSQPYFNEWLLNGEEPPTHGATSDDLMTWLQKASDSPELSSQKRNLVYALDIIAKGYAKNKISLSNVSSSYTSVGSGNGALNSAMLSDGGNLSNRGLRDPSPGSFQKSGMTSSNTPAKSKDMTDIQVLVKMQEEELRMSYQSRENAGNSSFLIRRDSQDSLDDTTMQAEIDYRLYQQPGTNARRRSRTHSRDRGPVTERNWDFVGLGNTVSNVGGNPLHLDKGPNARRSRSRASGEGSQERYQSEVSGTYGQVRSTLGVPTVKRKSNREMLEEASRARANQISANRGRQGTYNARGSQEAVTGSGDFTGSEIPNELVTAPPPLPVQSRSRRRSYSVEHYNPQAPAINSRNNSQENLQQMQRVESRESLPGTKPTVRGRQGRRDSGDPVTAAGDEGLNDSVFTSPAAGVVQPIIRGRSVSSGINSASGQRSRQNSYTKPLNGSFTKLNSAFSNELIPRVPSRDSLTRRGSLGGDSSRRGGGADLSSSESCPGGDSPTPYHTPRTSRPAELATQKATVRKPRRMKAPNEHDQTQQNNQNIENANDMNNRDRAKPGVRPSGRAMQSVRGMTHSSPAGNMTPERMSPASQLDSPSSRPAPKTVVKNQTSRRLPKPEDARDPRKSLLKKPGQVQEAPSAAAPRRAIPKRPTEGSAPNVSSKPNSQSGTRHSSPQVPPSHGRPVQSKVASRQSNLSASAKMVTSSSTGSLSQKLAGAAADHNSAMPLERSSQMSRSTNIGRSGAGEMPQKQGRSSQLPTAKSSAIPGPRSVARGRRQLPQVPTDSVASSENFQPQINSNQPSYPVTNAENDLYLEEKQQQQRHIYAPNDITQLSDRSQSSTHRSDVQSSNRSAFRLVKPIAQRPNQPQPHTGSGVGSGGNVGVHELPYSSAPAQVTVVGEDAILPLKYLIPARERDSPSLMDVYSGDEIFDGNDVSISQWDDGCF